MSRFQLLLQIGVYFLLLSFILGGLFWLNHKGKEITQSQQNSVSDNIQRIQDKAQLSDGNGIEAVRPTDTTKPTESQTRSQENKGQADDFGTVGSQNHQYLQSHVFSKLTIEIDYVDSVQPNQNAVNTLLSTLKQYADKPGGIVLSGENSLQAQGDRYSVQDLLSIAKKNRSTYSQGNAVSLYILYVNGNFADNPNALGVALNSSMFVIFKEKINAATTALVFASAIEQAVLVHELGHLWGLVNITYQSAIDHEDNKHTNHSKNSESVMFWAVEDLNVANLLKGGPPYQFDTADREDIEKIKKGLF